MFDLECIVMMKLPEIWGYFFYRISLYSINQELGRWIRNPDLEVRKRLGKEEKGSFISQSFNLQSLYLFPLFPKSIRKTQLFATGTVDSLRTPCFLSLKTVAQENITSLAKVTCLSGQGLESPIQRGIWLRGDSVPSHLLENRCLSPSYKPGAFFQWRVPSVLLSFFSQLTA